MNGRIRGLRQWVGYQTKPRIQKGQPLVKANGTPKLDKIPKNPNTGAHASTTDPSTWSDYETATKATQRNGWNGVGFVFTKEANITGIDVDDCIDRDGNLSEFAATILRLMDSYAERSPSGEGIHILVGGTIPRAIKKKEIEIYDSGRFFTFTGEALPGYRLPIANRQEELDQLLAEIADSTEAPTKIEQAKHNAETLLSDHAIIEKARGAKNGVKFSQLWGGDFSTYPSQSEADSALCHMLAFWTGNDATVMDRLFRQSVLYRDKWDERHYSDGDTYGQRTIARAVANNADVYEPHSECSRFRATGQSRHSFWVMEDSDMPLLPEGAAIDPHLAIDACPWLDAYVQFSRQMSPRGYDNFHEAAGLYLLSVVAARRIVVKLGTKEFVPNLYLALCSHTTLFAKTTTARVAQDLLAEAGLDHLLLPNDLTPQAFVNELVPRLPRDYRELSPEKKRRELERLGFASQRGWFYEEFGSKIQAIMRDSGFMSEFRGHLRVFDDNPPRYVYRTMTRRDEVKQPYLALLANLTPADIQPYAKAGSVLWNDGFWARWAFVTPPVDHPPQYGRFPDSAIVIPRLLIEPIRRWHESLGVPSVSVEEALDDDKNPNGGYIIHREEIQPASCELGPGVVDAFYNYHDGLIHLAAEQVQEGNMDLTGNYGRFAEKAMRVAMLLASFSNGNRIELRHWARAQAITERWRGNLHNLVAHMGTTSPSQERQLQDQIVSVLKKHGTGTSADIGRYIRNVSGPEVNEVCLRLVKSGDLEVVETTSANTNRYALADR